MLSSFKLNGSTKGLFEIFVILMVMEIDVLQVLPHINDGGINIDGWRSSYELNLSVTFPVL